MARTPAAFGHEKVAARIHAEIARFDAVHGQGRKVERELGRGEGARGVVRVPVDAGVIVTGERSDVPDPVAREIGEREVREPRSVVTAGAEETELPNPARTIAVPDDELRLDAADRHQI